MARLLGAARFLLREFILSLADRSSAPVCQVLLAMVAIVLHLFFMYGAGLGRSRYAMAFVIICNVVFIAALVVTLIIGVLSATCERPPPNARYCPAAALSSEELVDDHLDPLTANFASICWSLALSFAITCWCARCHQSCQHACGRGMAHGGAAETYSAFVTSASVWCLFWTLPFAHIREFFRWSCVRVCCSMT